MPWCGGPGQPAGPQVLAASPPDLGVDVHVEHLEPRRLDQIAPADQQPGALRPADRLAARERHQIGALGDEAAQVGARRQAGRRVDDHRQPVPMRDLGDLRERRPCPACP